MICKLSAMWVVILCYLVHVSIAHLTAAPRAIRIMSPRDSSHIPERIFKGVRQGVENSTSTSKTMRRCSPRALERAIRIDDVCLSCTTDTETGLVSECAEGCCRSFLLSPDLEAAHFTTCYNGCCIRSIGILSPTSDREAGILNYDAAFLVKNDMTLDEILPTGQCRTQDGPSKKCGSTCAVFVPETTKCSSATSFQVPANGESFVDPPCDGVDDLPGALAPEGDNPDDSANATGPVGGDDERDGEGGVGATDPPDSEGASTGDVTIEPSPDSDEEKGVVASPTEEGDNGDTEGLDDSVGGTPQEDDETTEETTQGVTGAGTGSGTDDDAVCFPAEATVILENGATKRMDQLKVGDMVLVGAGKYSKIFGFTHQTNKYRGCFVEVRTGTGEVIRLTHGHYMYSDGVLRRAEEVRVGETVRLYDGRVSKIVEVGEWRDVGLFNPQTLEGDIVVDGIVVSTYTDAVDARMAHALLTPVRALSKWLDVSTMLSRMADGLRRSRTLVEIVGS